MEASKTMAKQFASQGDLEPKAITFVALADGVYAYTAEGDPNSGVIVGDDSVMVVDAQATPTMAQALIERVREVTDKPIRHLVLTHYHAVRVLGASAYSAEHIIASRGTYELIAERGQQDYDSELGRFPRLFQDADSIPGLTWPSLVFDGGLSVWLGKRRVEIMHLGRGHTKGDTLVWLPAEKVLFSGDLVEYGATPYTGDAYLRDWPHTLARLRELGAEQLVPGRGAALTSRSGCEQAIAGTQAFLTDLFEGVRKARQSGKTLKAVYDEVYCALQPKYGHWVIFDHCLPFNVSRAYDESGEHPEPQIWTAERDRAMWQALESG
ncbi:metallo-beta-lactamase family protein [Nitrococcus mobilis Nb-231]|uniref:Metallo-beta-lactamase family protein n=2 Tax=Nitrococcus mobilis TaxID=35797 RepID=A4BNT8_9GAMM|nr:metallo-beta-lactamase family protein [Nitrococcus mobilis Nb-231]